MIFLNLGKAIIACLRSRVSTLKILVNVGQLKKLGITWDPLAVGWADDQRVHNEIDLLRKQLAPYELDNMRGLVERMLQTVKEIESLREVKDVRC